MRLLCDVQGMDKIMETLDSAPLYKHWGSVQAVRPIGGVEA